MEGDIMLYLKVLPILGLMVLGLGLTGCETIEGAGKDIEKAGESVQDAVR